MTHCARPLFLVLTFAVSLSACVRDRLTGTQLNDAQLSQPYPDLIPLPPKATIPPVETASEALAKQLAAQAASLRKSATQVRTQQP